MAETVTIVGGTVAALVAALSAACRGCQVALYVDPARIGGSFAGVVAGQRRLDLGPRLFELDYEGSAPRPISAFDPENGNHRPVIHAVATFIRSILGDDLRPAAEPEMWIGGGRTRCPLMTADLSSLPGALSAEDRACILTDARTTALADATLEQASIDQHGPRLHALLIAPVCAKQHRGWPDLPAADRRKLWAALFHPATVTQAFAGRPIDFRPHRPVATTRTHQAHPFVDRLMQAVRAQPHIAVLPAGPLTGVEAAPSGCLALRFGSHAIRVPAEGCAIGAPPDQVFRAAGTAWRPDRMVASIMWLEVPDHAVRHAPSTLMIAEPAMRVLRISNAGSIGGHTTFAVEFGAGRPCGAEASSALRSTGLVGIDAVVRLVHAVSAPGAPVASCGNRATFQAAAAQVGDWGVDLLAGARRFGFDSLNDQIADGLHFGECRC